MKIKVLKTEAEYEAALAEIEKLMDNPRHDPDRLELLALLVRDYEDRNYPIDLPDPVEAIKFRMEQMGLTRKDMERYLGSKSKVSEVLSGKRPLSLSMIKSLHEGLGIPAAVLLGKPDTTVPEDDLVDWSSFPLKEMLERGWLPNFQGSWKEAKNRGEELLRDFFRCLGPQGLQPAMYRKNDHIRARSEMDPYALLCWQTRVIAVASARKLPVKYKKGTVTTSFLDDLARLSYFDEGPRLAREFLEKHGIHLVVEPHLKKTHLDGAALTLDDGTPVVALTLRYDRIDNFWFCLFHELAHLSLHLDTGELTRVFDEFDDASSIDSFESDADRMAQEALIPSDVWNASEARLHPTKKAIYSLSERLRISPSIIAGRVRYETGNYGLFSELVGRGRVRRLFD